MDPMSVIGGFVASGSIMLILAIAFIMALSDDIEKERFKAIIILMFFVGLVGIGFLISAGSLAFSSVIIEVGQ